MRATGKNLTVNINSLNVSYNDEGAENAPVIIFIHAFPLNKDMWELQTEVLKYYYRTVSYDVRGHGNSDAGVEDFSIDLFANDLINFMDELNIPKATLCGLSMGGYIALNAAGRFPNRIEALVLCDTQCIADSEEAREKRMRTIDDIREKGIEKFADETLKNLFTPASFIKRKEQVTAARNMILKNTEYSLANTLFAMAQRKETCSILPDMQVPGLIMAGKDDQITPPSSAEVIHRRLNHSTLHIIEHAGHLSNLENTDEFNQHLKEFLNQTFRKSTSYAHNGEKVI